MSKVLNFTAHPDFKSVQSIYQVLSQAHFRVYLAGGCVRDGLLGLQPRDFDIATNALPEQVESLFPKTKPIGKAFGVILVIEDGVEVEVTTFRSDGGYQDSRRPDSVKFLESDQSEKEDAIRRDFTINAMFYDLNKNEVVDYVDGLSDLNHKVIRAVGDPEKRFAEDHLRILRAVRFVGQLGFQLEDSTRRAVQKLATTVKTVSGERLHAELDRLLESQNVNQASTEMFELGLIEPIFGQLKRECESLPDFKKTDVLIQRWGLFFNWLSENAQIFDLETIFVSLRFSNTEKNSLKKILYWTENPRAFEEKNLGELIDLSFDENSFFGMKEFVVDSTSEKFKKLLERHLYYNGQRPIPQTTANQLKDQGLSGLDLGNKLKELFWKQLIG